MTELIVYWLYEDLFKFSSYKRILLSKSALEKEPSIIDDLINIELDHLNAIDVVEDCGFLNMIIQTQSAEIVVGESLKLLACIDIKPERNGILFHRTNLLILISFAAKRIKDDSNVSTTRETKRDKVYIEHFCKALALVNTKLSIISDNKDYVILSEFIRSYPHSESQNTSMVLYTQWLKRYWHIYNDLIKELEENKKDLTKTAMNCLECYFGVEVREYYKIITLLFVWFLYAPYCKKYAPNSSSFKDGFDLNNRNSFHVNESLFSGDSKLIALLKAMAINVTQLNEYNENIIKKNNEMKNKLDSFFVGIFSAFDHPVVMFDQGISNVLDLQFLIEAISTGIFWHMQRASGVSIFDHKSQYGYLLELYFNELLGNIFDEVQATKGDADAVLIHGDFVLVFEFTVEFYKITSLYGYNIQSFENDLTKILFNNPKSRSESVGKKDKGKFIKLDGYVEKYKNIYKDKAIIPIFVTERYLGDYDLINTFGAYLENNIKKLGLKNLQEIKPLIICLDDLEVFWKRSGNKIQSASQFIECVQKWQASNKVKFWYNFSYFIEHQLSAGQNNREYDNFFGFQAFFNKIFENQV